MAREKEIKIRLTALALPDFVQRIADKGFVLTDTEEQEDIYFDTVDWRLYFHIAALRMRKVAGSYVSLTFKKMFYLPSRADQYHIEEFETKFPDVDQEVVHSIVDELELSYTRPLSSPEELATFFRAAGYLDEQHMSKTRLVYRRSTDEIVIDDVDKIGTIIELECHDKEPIDVVRTLLAEGEWKRSLEGTSHVWLENVKGLPPNSQNIARFQSDPAWNVWPHERMFYDAL